MAIEIIGAGFGRTGTTSLKAALERLGYMKCHHMTEVMENPSEVVAWMGAFHGERIDWRTLLTDFRATTDWPACQFYRELMAEYPDAKVILTVRDPDRWYESTRETIYALNTNAPWWLRAILRSIGGVLMLAEQNVWAGTFGGMFDDREHAIGVFNAHIEEVKRVVPPERLLVYSVKEGWGPLCEFLRVPVPDEPFPRLNERNDLKAIARRMRIAGVLVPALLIAAAVAAVVLSMRFVAA